jgi:hypothetical protein
VCCSPVVAVHPDTNKRKTVCLESTDVLQVKIGKHRGAAYISSRTMHKAAHNKTVKEAMELQVAGRGGNKRKHALADIKADIANKRLFVRKGLPTPQSTPTAQYGEDSNNSSTNSTNSTDCHYDTPWEVAQDRRGPRPGDETRLDALLGRFAGPGPLLVLCCFRLILNDFLTCCSAWVGVRRMEVVMAWLWGQWGLDRTGGSAA